MYLPAVDGDKHHWTYLALVQEGLQVDIVDVTGDREGYWSLMRAAWGQGDTFVFVDHDVIPSWGTVYGMFACHEPWCTVEIMIGGGLHPWTFGCVKFDRTLINLYPDLLDQFRSRDFRSLDGEFKRLMDAYGISAHVHSPPAHHLHSGHLRGVVAMALRQQADR